MHTEQLKTEAMEAMIIIQAAQSKYEVDKCIDTQLHNIITKYCPTQDQETIEIIERVQAIAVERISELSINHSS